MFLPQPQFYPYPYSRSTAQLTGFEQIGDYTLRLHFNDDRSFHLNFLPRLIGRSLAPLREKDLFATVRLDPRRRALLWANGTEMDSATLRAWHAASRRPISGDKPLPPE